MSDPNFIVKICVCGCVKQWHNANGKSCSVCGKCEKFTLHHIESRTTRYSKKKLYVGIR
jgi:hypothetical protein